ncbi:DUF4070 domain-containing protein [Marispirochaeta sp.]|jgi:radical SAM superfamily enzyme YgiQ (UPF0313 family)|uniref:B12-binding domain-containing radical SAM protein n=1 Tax=Marispirochaeta sp. TaxID=2038653 RepID=UPI0029C981ED|nr:DUF4070 domain-containing protein [Marispirochaeta sp.]
MNLLLVYPEFPETFWSYKKALKFVSKKSGSPPLGLLTVAAMLPAEWNIKVVDMNVSPLRNSSIRKADFVFISGMSVQQESARKVIELCARLGTKTVAGGPLFTTGWENFPRVDHFVLNEAELTLPEFLRDIQKGTARRIYSTEQWPDITDTPLPRWDLIKMKKYASMSVQHSRGCPFDCEFCDITLLYGRKTRVKTSSQITAELDNIYSHGWRENVFFVDDNFIGSKTILKRETLPAIIRWMEEHRYPFTFNTQASINIADDKELLRLMGKAGFTRVFVGIETPNEESLKECSKVQNINRDMIASIKIINQHGMEVQGGFIVGFDSDPASIFEDQIRFIQESTVVTAMVGLLTALKGTKLYLRLKRENRLVSEETGNNTDLSINFKPAMNLDILLNGYKKIVSTIYSPKYYYKRVMDFLKIYSPPVKRFFRFRPIHILTLIKSLVLLGIIGKERFQYWKLMLWTIFRRPRYFPLASTLAIYGFHYRKVFEKLPRV